MELFRWDKNLHNWYLYDKPTGIHCYLIQVKSPMFPNIKRLPYETDIQIIPQRYIMLEALTDEKGAWSWKANSFSSVREALEYGTDLLGYFPKFRDPNELEEKTC